MSVLIINAFNTGSETVMKHSKLMLKSLVIAVSLALTACGGGSGGVHSNSTETGGGSGGEDTGNGHSGGDEITPKPPSDKPPVNDPPSEKPTSPVKPPEKPPVTPPTEQPDVPDNIPMPSVNPSRLDSSEQAIAIPLSKNQYTRSNNGEDNTQANRLNLKDARDQELDGRGVKVGIVDLPVSLNHPALPDNIVDLGQFGTVYNGEAYPHGDAVALNIAGKDVRGKKLGIAPAAQIYSASASDSRGAGQINIQATIKGFYALDKAGVKIVNNSYGTNYVTNKAWYIYDAKNYLNADNHKIKQNSYIGQLLTLVEDDMLFIWAAGNGGLNQPSIQSLLPLVEPELQKGWIAVAGVSADNKIEDYSNRCGDAKNWCMVAYYQPQTANLNAKPGEDINGLPLTTTSGTSFSAPQVTAAAVLVKQKYPWMSNDNLRTTLLTTATDLGAKGVDSVYGWGLLNIGKAVNGPAQFAFGDFNANVSSGQYIFSNDISGTGGLIKNGSGTLLLTGSHSYQGNTIINSGMLSLDGSSQSAAKISKDGTYQVHGSTGAVNNQGTFVSRDATINGDYSQSEEATFQTSLGSKTAINGTASLAGRLYFDGLKSGFVPQTGLQVAVINAQKRIGEFSQTALASGILLDGKASYDGDNVNFDVTRISARQAVQNNGLLTRSIADPAIEAAAAAIDTSFSQLDKLSSVTGTDGPTAELFAGANRIQNVQTAETLRRSLYSLSGAVYSNANVVNTLTLGKLNTDFMSSIRNDSAEPALIMEFNHSQNRWNPSEVRGKQNSNSGLLGVSKNFGNGWSGAAAYSFQNTDWSERDGSADIKSNGLTLGTFYAPANWRGAYLSGSLGYNRYSNDVTRGIWLGTTREDSGAKTKGNVWQLALNGGKAFAMKGLTLTPQLGLRYDYLQQNSFSEAGAEGYGLYGRKLNKGIVTGSAGLVAEYLFDIRDIVANIFGAVGVEHDFRDREYATRGGFSGIHSDARAGKWSSARTRWNAAIGSNVQVSRNMSAGIQYQYENGSHWHSNSGRANLKISF